jgi:hypothetical protein
MRARIRIRFQLLLAGLSNQFPLIGTNLLRPEFLQCDENKHLTISLHIHICLAFEAQKSGFALSILGKCCSGRIYLAEPLRHA